MLEYLYFLNTEGDPAARGDSTVSGLPGRVVNDAERRLGAMELAIETMIRLGVKSGAYSEQEFFDLARQIDNEDGVTDGRRDLLRMRKICPTCKRPNSAEKANCMWCTTSLIGVESQPTPPGATAL